MKKENLQEAVTKQYLGEFTEEVILPAINRLDEKVDKLENRFDGLENRFDGLENRFDGLENRFDWLEKKVDKNHDEIINVLDNQGKILEEMRAETSAHHVSYMRHEDQIKDHEKRLFKLEKGAVV